MTILTIPYRTQFTRQTERLLQAFLDHTDLPASAVLVPAAGNSSYMKQAGAKGTHGVSVGKHDKFLENMSALWPSDLVWPEDIPRPPPEKAGFDQLPQEARDALAARIERQKNRSGDKEQANG